MRRGKASEWTLLRQLAGNILPYLHWLPTFIVAWILIALFEGSALATVLVLVGVFASLTVGTWALFDRYSMFQNAEMRRALRARLRSSIPDLPAGRSRSRDHPALPSLAAHLHRRLDIDRAVRRQRAGDGVGSGRRFRLTDGRHLGALRPLQHVPKRGDAPRAPRATPVLDSGSTGRPLLVRWNGDAGLLLVARHR